MINRGIDCFKIIHKGGISLMGEESDDADAPLYFYQCKDCQLIFPQTEDTVNRCPKCGKLLTTIGDDPN
jgi:hypothetical protein